MFATIERQAIQASDGVVTVEDVLAELFEEDETYDMRDVLEAYVKAVFAGFVQYGDVWTSRNVVLGAFSDLVEGFQAGHLFAKTGVIKA